MAAVALLPPAASAAVIVQDGFTDGGRTNGADPLDLPWYQGTGGTLSVADDPAGTGFGAGNALFFDSGGTFRRFLGVFDTPITIAPGETLNLSFDYRFPAAPASTGGNFRFGLYNDGGTPLTADTTSSSARTNDFGYAVTTNPGSAAANGTSITKEAAGDDILGGSSPGGLVTFGTAGGSVASGTTPHTATLSVSRNLAGTALSFSGQLDNAAIFSGTDNSPSTFTFHEFALGSGGVEIDFAIDNVIINVVPEPTGALAISLVTGLLALRRRRRVTIGG